jgi:hypothetical protein
MQNILSSIRTEQKGACLSIYQMKHHPPPLPHYLLITCSLHLGNPRLPAFLPSSLVDVLGSRGNQSMQEPVEPLLRRGLSLGISLFLSF